MGAYYDTYTSPEPGNDFMRDMSVKGTIPIFREMLSEPGSESDDVRDMAAFFANIQRQERRKGGPVSRRTTNIHKLIRYQRNGITRLSKAVGQNFIRKATKQSPFGGPCFIIVLGLFWGAINDVIAAFGSARMPAKLLVTNSPNSRPEYLLGVIQGSLDRDINGLAKPTIGNLEIDEVCFFRYVNPGRQR